MVYVSNCLAYHLQGTLQICQTAWCPSYWGASRWEPVERRGQLIAGGSVCGVGYVGMVKREPGYGVVLGEEEEDRMDEAMRERLNRQVDSEEVRRVNQSWRDTERSG